MKYLTQVRLLPNEEEKYKNTVWKLVLRCVHLDGTNTYDVYTIDESTHIKNLKDK